MSSRYGKRFLLLILLPLIFSESARAQSETRASARVESLESETRAEALVEHAAESETRASARAEHSTLRVSPLPTRGFLSEARMKNGGGDFRSTEQRERYGNLKAAEKFSFRPARPIRDDGAATSLAVDESFRWGSATKQTLMFLAVQHGYALTQPKTREALKGKFWKDYADSVKSLHGWADGGRFFTNYIAHPMQGAFLGYIQVQNDPKGSKQQFAQSGDYWRSRLKAMAWSAAWSTQFEIGPVSQASIGNVGLKGKQTYIDIVITPTVGTAWLIAEDAIDRFVTKRIERSSGNFYLRIFARMLLSPTRTIANVFRFKEPWYRDRPTAR